MNIKLNDDYCITSDSFQYILNKKEIYQTGKNAGEVRMRALGFYRTMEDVLVGYLQKKALESEAKTIKEYIKDFKEIQEEIKKLMSKNLKGE